ncbi:hypothetical protein NP493_369g01012 [Ridgeia piscesae]|uniref:Uncharacterized protein n=1 Tax=Ridgeia piscesae TaxID=27915 RepID=A0AAD9L2T7_RIDPI|nr:hypothetical protein NP493_369g01012 [Ridgeia piscesae]
MMISVLASTTQTGWPPQTSVPVMTDNYTMSTLHVNTMPSQTPTANWPPHPAYTPVSTTAMPDARPALVPAYTWSHQSSQGNLWATTTSDQTDSLCVITRECVQAYKVGRLPPPATARSRPTHPQ